jgi:hypothetical protein
MDRHALRRCRGFIEAKMRRRGLSSPFPRRHRCSLIGHDIAGFIRTAFRDVAIVLAERVNDFDTAGFGV